MTAEQETFTISELAAELRIRPSAIRYYEKIGLIKPERKPGKHRRYTRKDRARLRLILRGKRFGATLDQIGKMIGGPEAKISEANQISTSLRYIDQKLEDIASQKKELEQFQTDLLELRDKLLKKRRKPG